MEALNERNLKSLRFPKLKLCLVTGEPAHKDMIRRWKEETGVELVSGYGQTESVCCYRHLLRSVIYVVKMSHGTLRCDTQVGIE